MHLQCTRILFIRASSVRAIDMWGKTERDNDIMMSLDAALGFRADDDEPPRRKDPPPAEVGTKAPAVKRDQRFAERVSVGPSFVLNQHSIIRTKLNIK